MPIISSSQLVQTIPTIMESLPRPPTCHTDLSYGLCSCGHVLAVRNLPAGPRACKVQPVHGKKAKRKKTMKEVAKVYSTQQLSTLRAIAYHASNDEPRQKRHENPLYRIKAHAPIRATPPPSLRWYY